MSRLEEAFKVLGNTEDNRENIKLLFQRADQVIPFVGGGLSADFGYPMWGDLLKAIASPEARPQIETLVANGKFEEAAELIDSDRPNRFDDYLKSTFDPSKIARLLTKGAVRHIPYVARGPIVTTNFDRLIEIAFEQSGGSIETLPGRRIHEASDAIQSHKSVLLKLHGDYNDLANRVLTLTEYVREYGSSEPNDVDTNKPIPKLLGQAFQARPVLFLGCSLKNDRTTLVIARIAEELPGIKLFALLSESERTKERCHQLDVWKIRPIFYSSFEQIDRFLSVLARNEAERSNAKSANNRDRSSSQWSICQTAPTVRSPAFAEAEKLYKERKYSEALTLFKQQSLLGDPMATAYVGMLYHFGLGVDRNLRIAARWYQKAVEANDGMGMTGLAQMYELGVIDGQSNLSLARTWYRRAAEAGYPKAMSNLARMYFYAKDEQRDEKQAVEWWTAAAIEGDATAMRNLGYLHLNGRAGVRRDHALARDWYRRAADTGDVRAMSDFGYVTRHCSCNAAEDDVRARVLYHRSAVAGDGCGMNNLAYMLWWGLGGDEDRDISKEWLRKAEQLGNLHGLDNLIQTAPNVMLKVSRIAKSIFMAGVSGAKAANMLQSNSLRSFQESIIIDPNSQPPSTGCLDYDPDSKVYQYRWYR